MQTDQWQKIEQLFHQAIELPEPLRSDFVDNSCRDNPEIARELISLLAQHNENDQLLEVSPASAICDALDSAASELAAEMSDSFHRVRVRTKGNSSPDRMSDDQLRLIVEGLRDGEYEFQRLIGRGGMGAVLQVYDGLLQRQVALKFIGGSNVNEQVRQKIIHESQAAAKVKSDHIVEIYNVCKNSDAPYLAMELINGPSLRQLILEKRQLEPELAAELARQIAIGLSAAHRANLIHRDIKPANILLEPLSQEANGGFRAKLIDFGLARMVDDSRESRDNDLAGTLAYMSPEQITSSAKVDQRVDIYSLGATLYEMLTGEVPFRGAPHRVIRQIEFVDPIRPRKLDDRLPRDLESICLMAMHKDAARRYQTADLMAEDLQRYLEGKPTVARPLSPVEWGWRWYRRNFKVAVSGTVALAAMLALAMGSLWFALTVARKNREIVLHKTSALDAQIRTVINAKPDALPLAIKNLEAESDAPRLLKEEILNAQYDEMQRLNAALALSQLGFSQTDYVVSQIDSVLENPGACNNIIRALELEREHAVALIQAKIDRLDLSRRDDAEVFAKHLIVLMHLTDGQPLEGLASLAPDPTGRTLAIHNFPRWHGETEELASLLKTDRPGNWIICQMLGLIDPRELRGANRDSIIEDLENLQRNTRFHAVHSSARWALSQWGCLPSGIHGNPTGLAEPPQAVNRDWEIVPIDIEPGLVLVKLPPCRTKLGRLDAADQFGGYPPHDVELTRAFAIGNSEVTVGQYRAFLRDEKYPVADKPAQWETWQPDTITSPTDLHPAQQVSWNDAILFCNWLSHKAGLKPCYSITTSPTEQPEAGGDSIVARVCDFDANGFRLPTEAEWEVACRAGSSTRFCFGDDSKFLEHYGLASSFRQMASAPHQSCMPNAFGLFAAHGNVWEWCHDWQSGLTAQSAVDPRGPEKPDDNVFAKIYRGGGIATVSGDTESSSRGFAPPDARYKNLGFRVARTLD